MICRNVEGDRNACVKKIFTVTTLIDRMGKGHYRHVRRTQCGSNLESIGVDEGLQYHSHVHGHIIIC